MFSLRYSNGTNISLRTIRTFVFFTRKSLAQLAASAGFVEIETKTCGMNRPLRDLIVATNILLKARKR